jgi:UDP-3-O-[3-hydroxymyristoyl] N-acetylglucosamine deacetylase
MRRMCTDQTSGAYSGAGGQTEVDRMKLAGQTTLADRICLSGIGVHSNASASLNILPAEAHTGIVFRRTGLKGQPDREIRAEWSNVAMTELCTVIGDPSSATISTIEHLLAAFSGLGIDNAVVEVDGPEVPIMDGSAAAFVDAIDQVGTMTQAAPCRYLRILKTVRIENGRAFSELRPCADGFRLEVEIDFATNIIGRQTMSMLLTPQNFRREIARARTFGFLRDVERLWKAGFALGASLENTVALDETRVLNPEGLRYGDEFVRHKTLDAVGDLALAGAPILGAYRSYCGGHKMNVSVLEAVFADRTAYEFVDAVRPRVGGRAPLEVAAAAAFAPDRT